MRPAPRIPRSVPKPKRQPDPRRHAEHRKFVASLPCTVCGASPCDAAHIRVGTDGGTALKPSDKFCVPLCRTVAPREGCHARQHMLGELTFWSRAGIDPMVVAARLWAVSGNRDQGERVVFRAMQAARLKHA